MNYKMIRYTLGWILLFEAVFLLFPTMFALFGREQVLSAFLFSVTACLAAGTLLVLRRPENTTLYAREGFLIVALSWILLSLFGALPFFVSRTIPSFLDALFETVSGFTTTGASILAEVESLPRSILLWRSFTHWVGGMGVLVLLMAFLPLSGGQNMHIMKAESPGPSVSKLVPRVRTTALILYSLYLALTLLQFIFLLFGGIGAFDALNIAFATAGTGGFGIRNDSMASFSPYIQNVTTVFMLIFSINFSSYYLLLHRRVKEFFGAETRVFLAIILVAGLFVSFSIRGQFSDPATAFRHGFFAVASLSSSTGFSSTDFALFPGGARFVLMFILFIGACAGSTGGGIKVSRVIIAVKAAFRELSLALHPKQKKLLSMDGRTLESDVVRSCCCYFLLFIAVFVPSVFVLSFDSGDFLTNFTAVATTLNNCGPGLGAVGPTGNFGFLSPLSKLILIFDMLAGRLELLPMLLLFTPATFRKQ